jgi:hypothetical protein
VGMSPLECEAGHALNARRFVVALRSVGGRGASSSAKKEASLRNSKGQSKLVFWVASAMLAAMGGAAVAGPIPNVKSAGSRWQDGVVRVVVELGLKPSVP